MAVIFDIALSLSILALAVGAVSSKNRVRAVFQFIVMGLLVAAAWLRLGATDVAMAELSVGAALTGALMLRAAKSGRTTLPRSEP